MKPNDSMRVQAVDRAMRIMALLSESPRTVAEIGEAVGIGVSGTQKLLYTLADHDLVRRDGGRYVLAVGCVRLAQEYLSRNPLSGEACRNILVNLSLQMGSRVVLATLEGIDQINLLQVDVAMGLRGNETPLKVGHAWSQATGQVLLAYATEEIVAAHLEAYPVQPKHIGLRKKADFFHQLEAVRQEGFAFVEFIEAGMRFLAVPIRDANSYVVAALGAHFSQQHAKKQQQAWITQAALDISGILGFTQEQ